MILIQAKKIGTFSYTDLKAEPPVKKTRYQYQLLIEGDDEIDIAALCEDLKRELRDED